MIGVNYGIQVDAAGRFSVQRLAITVHRTSAKSVLTVTRGGGNGRLSTAERAQLDVVLRRVDMKQVWAAGVRASCSGPPIGDVGGVELDLGGAVTDCPPASAQPLVAWLERFAAATPEMVIQRAVHVTQLRPTPSASLR